jgi:hypothetical protein
MRAELGRARPFSSVVAANGHEISDEEMEEFGLYVQRMREEERARYRD